MASSATCIRSEDWDLGTIRLFALDPFGSFRIKTKGTKTKITIFAAAKSFLNTHQYGINKQTFQALLSNHGFAIR